MRTFLEEVCLDILQNHNKLHQLKLILPSKRAGLFLKQYIGKHIQQTSILPEILSIEEWIQEVGQLHIAPNPVLLFELFETYQKMPFETKDPFHEFVKWGQILLQDFNEVDRYLLPAETIFNDLTATHKLQVWSKGEDASAMVKNYIHFSKSLYPIYQAYQNNLQEKQLAYQGMVYKKATKHINNYSQEQTNRIIFIGFNALNAAEEHLIQTVLQAGKGDVYWDIDKHFVEDPIHKASYFIKKHQKWHHFEKNTFKWMPSHYNTPKKIHITGVPKQYAQANIIADILSKSNNISLQKAAVVLGDENLLTPLIHSIPSNIEAVNITMGFPLQNTPLTSLFNTIFEILNKSSDKGWYYTPICKLLSHPYIQQLLQIGEKNNAAILLSRIYGENRTFLSTAYLQEALEEAPPSVKLIFALEKETPSKILQNCISLLLDLKACYENLLDTQLVLEYLFRFYTLFQQIQTLMHRYPFVSTLNDLKHIYKELLQSETLDFEGEPLQGIQIMGMLESRNLDYETVIISGLNEGILPAGKSNNSFFPFDLKVAYGMPTYAEKDAIYTYHFYRLLQRATTIHLIYNTEPDTLEGQEKSRFISQILSDSLDAHEIHYQIASPGFKIPKQKLFRIPKTKEQLLALEELAQKGFSASSLTNYIRNPIDFFHHSLLQIRPAETMEETIAHNTLGTIVHETLETLYRPFVGQVLQAEKLKALLKEVPIVIQTKIAQHYKSGDTSTGFNFLISQVAVQFVLRFIQKEIQESKTHEIKLLSLEDRLEHRIQIENCNTPIVLKGFIDRIDTYDGVLRIIDYKTGKVENTQLQIPDWDILLEDYKYSKAFQVLFYALLYTKGQLKDPLQAGIISFRNTKAGFLPFGIKQGRSKASVMVTQEHITEFSITLKQLLNELFTLETPFEEKEV